MKRIILIALMVVFFVTGCKKDDGGDGTKQSTYPNLTGEYWYNYDGSTQGFKYKWTFDNTNKATKNTWAWITSSQQWSSWGTEFKEWSVENGVFYERSWNDKNENFTSHSFEFINNNSFKLDGTTYTKE